MNCPQALIFFLNNSSELEQFLRVRFSGPNSQKFTFCDSIYFISIVIRWNSKPREVNSNEDIQVWRYQIFLRFFGIVLLIIVFRTPFTLTFVQRGCHWGPFFSISLVYWSSSIFVGRNRKNWRASFSSWVDNL